MDTPRTLLRTLAKATLEALSRLESACLFGCIGPQPVCRWPHEKKRFYDEQIFINNEK